MYEEFISNRIAQLRIAQGVSARDMSLSLGQNEAYINKIENKKSLPSIKGLLYICDYFHITPHDFFAEDNQYPEKLNKLVEELKKLKEPALSGITTVVKELTKEK